MRKLLLTLWAFWLSCSVHAQMFTPSASALPDGQLNQAYSGQVINFTVPQNATVSGSVVEQAIGVVFPQTQPVLGLLNIDNQNFDLLVDRTSLIVQGLPNGLSATCDATPCTYIVNASGYITIDGAPTETGQFSIDILTLTEGDVDISSITGGVLSSFGLPTSFALPTPVPSSLSEEGYTMTVTDPSGIRSINDVFSIDVFPNPTNGNFTLSVDAKKSGMALIELFSIAGKLILSTSTKVAVGQNRLPLSSDDLSKGIYFLKLTLGGNQTLVRIEKI
ncbi:MAG: T9SS type A sorting domain-containing protein [Flavobacteriales bacterium]|nr:T9SS type A sorting domain-containing protein [Flavobacteriales bacterium]